MYCKNRSSYENFKLKLCTCDQSHALGKRTKFQLEILTINVIDSIVYFREIVLETSQKVSETTPWSLGPLKSNGALVNFYLRAQWTPQNLKICNVLLQNEPLKFDSDLWKFTWWARGPGPSARCLLRTLIILPCHQLQWYCQMIIMTNILHWSCITLLKKDLYRIYHLYAFNEYEYAL